jgi:chloride channel 3/4/5
MADHSDERAPLLEPNGHEATDRRIRKLHDEEAHSIIGSHVTGEEQKLVESSIGERLPYNDYTTIDWLHDLVKDSYRLRFIHSRPGLKYKILSLFDEASGWVAAAIIGTLTACVAFLVDVAEATVSDWYYIPTTPSTHICPVASLALTSTPGNKATAPPTPS